MSVRSMVMNAFSNHRCWSFLFSIFILVRLARGLLYFIFFYIQQSVRIPMSVFPPVSAPAASAPGKQTSGVALGSPVFPLDFMGVTGPTTPGPDGSKVSCGCSGSLRFCCRRNGSNTCQALYVWEPGLRALPSPSGVCIPRLDSAFTSLVIWCGLPSPSPSNSPRIVAGSFGAHPHRLESLS